MNTAQMDNANNLRLCATGVTAVQAPENGDYTPLLALGANVSGINKMPQVATSMNVLSAANAISTNNPAALLSAAGNLTNSPDLKLAGSATRLVNAINSGDQAAIAVAGMAFSSAVRTNAPNAASTIKTTLFGPSGSPINPNGSSTTTSDAGPLSGINTASADGSAPQIDVGGPPIFAGTAKAANVSEPVGYRLMTMDEADARPEGSYYDITQNAWFAPDSEGVNDITNLQNTLTGPVPAGYGNDVTNLDRTGGQNGVSGTSPYTSSTGPLSDYIPTIEVVGERPVSEIPEIVITADRPEAPLSPVVPMDVGSPGPVTPVVVNPPVVTPPAVVTPPTTPINPTPTKTTTTSSPLSYATQAIPKLDSSPQGLTRPLRASPHWRSRLSTPKK
jgi:hypothetical protein